MGGILLSIVPVVMIILPRDESKSVDCFIKTVYDNQLMVLEGGTSRSWILKRLASSYQKDRL